MPQKLQTHLGWDAEPENFKDRWSRNFPLPPHPPHTPPRALTLTSVSREKSLNCVLICISVHINEPIAYEYSYFLFCCLIKRGGREGEGGVNHDSIGDGAEPEWNTRTLPSPWQPWSRGGVPEVFRSAGTRVCVSKFDKKNQAQNIHTAHLKSVVCELESSRTPLSMRTYITDGAWPKKQERMIRVC